MSELEGTNTEFAETQQLSIIKASLPAAIKRYEQKMAHIGSPRLMPTMEEQHEQFYCAGYCDAIYDLVSGNVRVQSLGIDPVKKKRIVRP